MTWHRIGCGTSWSRRQSVVHRQGRERLLVPLRRFRFMRANRFQDLDLVDIGKNIGTFSLVRTASMGWARTRMVSRRVSLLTNLSARRGSWGIRLPSFQMPLITCTCKATMV